MIPEELVERIYNRIWDYAEGDCGVIDVIQDVLSTYQDGDSTAEAEEGGEKSG